MPMDRKEVEERGKALSKAQNGGEPASTIIGLLGALRKGVQPSEELLRSTKIGVLVNKLKAHPDKEIARHASELVAKWRAEIGKSGGRHHGHGHGHGHGHAAGAGNRPSSGGGVSTPKPAASPGPQAASSPAPASKGKTKHDVAPERRNSKVDKVNTKVTGNAVRDNCLDLMYNGLAHMTDEMPDDVLRIAIEVEEAAYATYKPETSPAYKDKIRSLFQNLKNKSNPSLRRRVLSGEIAPARFVAMSLDELKSAERRKEEAEMHKQNMDNAVAPKEEKSISSSLTCPKCHKRKVAYSQAQTRSADEPMTTFCHCTLCDHRWKFC